jgi:replication factor C subunit 3/5
MEVNMEMNDELLPWSEKYRPEKMEHIIYHNKIINIMNHYSECDDLPHTLFYGKAGTGKTSLIMAFAKQYYGENYDDMVLILNSSEERGINTVRNKIRQFVMASGTNSKKYKLVVLDEIDEMTADAQSILRKIIEKYINNVRFCFICNYLKKINPAIQSRCVSFRFNPIPHEYVFKHICYVCEKENIVITVKSINLIIKKTNGDMRKLLNILQSLWMYKYNSNVKYNNKLNNSNNSNITKFNIDDNVTEKILDVNNVKICEKYVSKLLSCVTSTEIMNILTYVQNNNFEKSCDYILNIITNDVSLSEIILSIYEILMNHITVEKNPIIKYSTNEISLIIQNISLINNNLSLCNNHNIQIYSFISVFYIK